jgi:magnesium and cobalt transporter
VPEPAKLKNKTSLYGRWFKTIQNIFSGLQSKEELIELIDTAENTQIIGHESRVMLEGVLNISDMCAVDIMGILDTLFMKMKRTTFWAC